MKLIKCPSCGDKIPQSRVKFMKQPGSFLAETFCHCGERYRIHRYKRNRWILGFGPYNVALLNGLVERNVVYQNSDDLENGYYRNGRGRVSFYND